MIFLKLKWLSSPLNYLEDIYITREFEYCKFLINNMIYLLLFFGLRGLFPSLDAKLYELFLE